MADPAWFAVGVCLANKLAQLQAIEPEKG